MQSMYCIASYYCIAIVHCIALCCIAVLLLNTQFESVGIGPSKFLKVLPYYGSKRNVCLNETELSIFNVGNW